MTDHVHDNHDIAARKGETLGDTVRRHLTIGHGRQLTSSPTLNEMSAMHTKDHNFGNDNPETDSETTKRQKIVIRSHLVAIGVALPDWVFERSYLSDLKTLERLVLAAYRARPDVHLTADQEEENPDSGIEGAPAGFDNPIQG